jgi:hypothetical protein
MWRRIKPTEWLLIIGTAACLVGCGARQHLTPTHGLAYRSMLRMQVANPNAAESSEAETGLDSQEAAIVAEAYRQGLIPAGSQAKADKSPVLMIAEEE